MVVTTSGYSIVPRARVSLKLMLEPIFDPDFLPFLGFRPHRRPMMR